MGRPLTDEYWLNLCVWVASQLGVDDASIIHEATGLPLSAIKTEIKKVKKSKDKPKLTPARIRSPGGGRKKKYHDLPAVLENLIEPGDSDSPLRWTCKGIRQLTRELKQAGCDVGETTARSQLHKLGYRWQGRIGEHPDSNDQFAEINRQVKD